MRSLLAAAPARRIAAVLSSICIAGCGPPTLIDLDGRPIKEPERLACVQGGWLAVDSSSAGIRAVLRLRGESPGADRPPWDLSTVELRIGGQDPVAPSRLSHDEPRCSEAAPTSGEPAREGEVEAANRPDVETGVRCLHAVRIEFLLPKLPAPSDAVTLTIGDKTSPVTWRQDGAPQ